MTIKKAYQEIVNHLEENQHASVADVLPRVIEMASAKVANRTGGTSFIKDADGNAVAVMCYYFKRWMPLVGDAAVEFGKKASTATGLNTMCKEGASNFTRQLREAKAAQADLLEQVKSGEIAPSDIEAKEAEINETRAQVVETELGFETREEVEAYLAENGVTLG